MVFSSDFINYMNSIQLVASDQVRGWLWKSLHRFLWSGPVTQETFMVRPGLISDISLSAAHLVSERCPDTNTQAMSAGKHCIVCIWWKNSVQVQLSDHSTSPPHTLPCIQPFRPAVPSTYKLVHPCLPSLSYLFLTCLTTPHSSGLSSPLILQDCPGHMEIPVSASGSLGLASLCFFPISACSPQEPGHPSYFCSLFLWGLT